MNRHQRVFPVDAAQVGALIDTLASQTDRLWPVQHWPRMKFDRALSVGAVGGHGPIRYHIERYTPGREIVFRFNAPKGFDGTHSYHVESDGAVSTRLLHVLQMQTSGPALLSWPLVFRPLHDALIEDSLDCAEAALCGSVARPSRWSPYVRLLRGALIAARRRR